MPYRIEHWSKPPPKGYETAKTKLINYLSYVPLPNKINDADYIELLEDHEDGPIHLAVFVAMLQLVSLQHKSVRNGWLTRNGRPDGRELSPVQIARLIRIDAQHVTTALNRLGDIGWVKYHEPAISGHAEVTQEDPTLTSTGAKGATEDPPGPDQGPNEAPPGPSLVDGVSDAFSLFQYGEYADNPMGEYFEPDHDYPPTFMRSPHIVDCYEISAEFYSDRVHHYPKRFPGVHLEPGVIAATVPAFVKLVRNGAIAVELLQRLDSVEYQDISNVLMWACGDTTPRNGFCWSDVINSIPRLRGREDGVSKFAKLEIAYRRHEESLERKGSGGFLNVATEGGRA